MDLFHVRGDNHKPQTDSMPGALPALWRHNVRDLEVALRGDAKGLGALTKGIGRSLQTTLHASPLAQYVCSTSHCHNRQLDFGLRSGDGMWVISSQSDPGKRVKGLRSSPAQILVD
jgi:hypothetical protein